MFRFLSLSANGAAMFLSVQFDRLDQAMYFAQSSCRGMWVGEECPAEIADPGIALLAAEWKAQSYLPVFYGEDSLRGVILCGVRHATD